MASKAVSSLKWLAIPGVVIGYIVVSGLTGFCPTCVGIMDTVLGRSASQVALGESSNIADLTARDLDGEPVGLDQFVGKPTIVELWATWCGPCRTQRDIMAALAPELEGKVNVVALSIDSGADVVRRHLASHEAIGAELMATPGVVAAMGNPAGIPAIGFVDARGELREVRMGVQSAEQIRKALKNL
ncbi:MAG: TlpA family protein disulfide reductase [Phycisphaerales bacterium JB039]